MFTDSSESVNKSVVGIAALTLLKRENRCDFYVKVLCRRFKCYFKIEVYAA